VPDELQDDNEELQSLEFDRTIRHTPLETIDWFEKEKDNLQEIIKPVIVRTKVWFDKRMKAYKSNRVTSPSQEASSSQREASTPTLGISTQAASSPPRVSTLVYTKKGKIEKMERVQETTEEEEEGTRDHEESNLEGGNTEKEEEEDDKQKNHTSEAETVVIPESSVKEALVKEVP
ncbi:hypothetical protein KI387_043849, partial [Taxus chinensis]